jgi:hypothetical protein
LIAVKSGRTYSGLVKDEGTSLRLLTYDDEVRIAKADIDERSV